MSKKLKIITFASIVLTIVLVVVANVWRNHAEFRSLSVHIDYQEADTLITDTQVRQLVLHAMPTLQGTAMKDIDLRQVELMVAQSPYLDHCVASTAMGGCLVIHAVQRRPIVRIVTGGNEYYLDGECHRIPLSQMGSADVIVASGSIRPRDKGEQAVWTLANHLDQHPDYGILFDQIYRDNHGILFLTPKLGNHTVEFGDTTLMDDKFQRLMAMYTRGLPQTGWNTYYQLSVRYCGQIVGRRNE